MGQMKKKTRYLFAEQFEWFVTPFQRAQPWTVWSVAEVIKMAAAPHTGPAKSTPAEPPRPEDLIQEGEKLGLAVRKMKDVVNSGFQGSQWDTWSGRPSTSEENSLAREQTERFRGEPDAKNAKKRVICDECHHYDETVFVSSESSDSRHGDESIDTYVCRRCDRALVNRDGYDM
jgi:hypothetical protein